MKQFFTTIFGMLLLTISISAQNKLTTSVEWLAEHLDDKNLVLLHIGDKSEFDAGHIPGARFVTLRDVSAPPSENGLVLQVPTVERARETFENLGVSDKSLIVLYFGKDWVTPTTRVYYTLDYLGLGKQTLILDGGMPAWTKAGKPLTKEVATPTRGKLILRPDASKLADVDWLKNNLNKPEIAVLDARTANFYNGTDAGGRARAGHIPTAKNVPFPTLITENNKFKSAAEWRKILTDAGVDKNDTVVAYCHIGQQGSLLYFAAKTAGYNVKLYDGSFEEWSARFDLPVTDPLADKRKTKISFVTAEWLGKEAANARDLKIIDARNNVGDYFTSHVPGAVHLADAALRAPRGGFPVQYLDQQITSTLLAQAGITKTNRVAIYSDGTSVLGATMIAYILERLGHQGEIYLLEGGFAPYKDAQKTSQEYPRHTNARYDVLDNRAVRATLDDVKAAVAKTTSAVKIVDARPAEQYRGEINIWVRNGHIPGAINLPWRTLTKEANAHKLKSVEEIKQLVAAAGIKESDDIILYCGTSREASLEYVVLKHVLGFPKVRLYEGSWAEYAAHADLKMETGASAATAAKN